MAKKQHLSVQESLNSAGFGGETGGRSDDHFSFRLDACSSYVAGVV